MENILPYFFLCGWHMVVFGAGMFAGYRRLWRVRKVDISLKYADDR